MNYFKSENFKKIVYIYESEKLIEVELGVLCLRFARKTLTPGGYSEAYHRVGKELRLWSKFGCIPKLIKQFESEKKAEHALMLCYLNDLNNCDNSPDIYYGIIAAKMVKKTK